MNESINQETYMAEAPEAYVTDCLDAVEIKALMSVLEPIPPYKELVDMAMIDALENGVVDLLESSD